MVMENCGAAGFVANPLMPPKPRVAALTAKDFTKVRLFIASI
jgi:hypothetical protein